MIGLKAAQVFCAKNAAEKENLALPGMSDRIAQLIWITQERCWLKYVTELLKEIENGKPT